MTKLFFDAMCKFILDDFIKTNIFLFAVTQYTGLL
jgi:hypothetical protein